MTSSNIIITALNTTIDPILDKIIMDAADLENGFNSYEKAVDFAATRCTYEQAMTLSAAYKRLSQTMEDIAVQTSLKL
jgi:hypothetical protein